MGRSLLFLVFAACSGSQPPAKTAPLPDEKADPGESDAPAFEVAVTPPASCVHATTCEAKINLTALSGFKVNAEYPFKFVGDVGPQISFDGTGTFAHGDKKTGTMTIKFKPEAAGTIEVSGTFKLSVCTDAVCKIEQPKIKFAVTVT